MAKIKFGVVGIGGMGRTHITNLQQRIPGSEVIAVCARHEDRVRAIQAECNIQFGYTNYDEMLANPEIDAIVIATGAEAHKEQAIKACAAHKHIFCEKPLAKTVEDCLAVEQAVVQNPDRNSQSDSCGALTPPMPKSKPAFGPARLVNRSFSKGSASTRLQCSMRISTVSGAASMCPGSSKWAVTTPTWPAGSLRANRRKVLPPVAPTYAMD